MARRHAHSTKISQILDIPITCEVRLNAASSLILKWKTQFACALVWWTTCAICVLRSGKQATIALVAAIFLCQIVFGIYAMVRESGRQREIVHA
jgi:hypothetical protein